MKLTKRVLTKKARPVRFDYPVANLQLRDALFDFMTKEQGIGLAAPQVGISKRLFVMDIEGDRRACFNPEITGVSEISVHFEEGCLSFQGDQCIIARPQTVSVQYQDHKGNWYKETLEGLWARCFQHELDHLDGITMWDRYREQHAKQS